MQTVGELLREEREKKGLSIKDIETAISIRSLYINAIEEDNYSVIPGEVYLKGFIRNYANYLGLDGQEMVNSYRQSQLPPITHESIASETLDTAVEKPKSKSKPKQSNGNSGKLLMIGLLAVCLIGAAWWLFGSSKSSKEPQSNNIQSQQAQSPNQPQTTPPAAPAAPVQTKPVVVIAKYTDQCWTSVTADGKEIYEGTPNAKDTITWEAQKNITITVGNAGGVEVIANGQSAGKLGGKGEVVTKTFLPK